MSDTYDFLAMAEALGIKLTKEQVKEAEQAAAKVPFLRVVNEECANKFSNVDTETAIQFVESAVSLATDMLTVVTPNPTSSGNANKHQLAFTFPGLGKVGIYVTVPDK